MNIQWTDEIVEYLMAIYSQGKRGKDLLKEINTKFKIRCTRSALSGKMTRLGMVGRGSPNSVREIVRQVGSISPEKLITNPCKGGPDTGNLKAGNNSVQFNEWIKTAAKGDTFTFDKHITRSDYGHLKILLEFHERRGLVAVDERKRVVTCIFQRHGLMAVRERLREHHTHANA